MAESKETKPGAVDDNATKRVKDRQKEQQKILDEIFNDNQTGRYGKPIDK